MAKNTILGIDIGTDRLKLALVDSDVVMQTAAAKMPENLMREGRITSIDTMSGLISATMKESGIKASRAAIVLPRPSGR